MRNLGYNTELQFANGSNDQIPCYELNIATPGVCGSVVVGLVPTTYKFPCCAGLLLGNDLYEKGHSSHIIDAVTRSQTKGNAELNQPEVPAKVSVPPVNRDVNSVNDLSTCVSSSDKTQHSLLIENNQPAVNNIGICMDNLFSGGLDSGTNTDAVIQLQKDDVTLKPLFDVAIQNQNSSHDANKLVEYCIHDNGLLIRKYYCNNNQTDDEFNDEDACVKIFVPLALRSRILHLAHSTIASGHFGVAKTKQRIQRYFFWPGLKLDVVEYCRSCDYCQRLGKASITNKSPMVIPPIVEKALVKCR